MARTEIKQFLKVTMNFPKLPFHQNHSKPVSRKQILCEKGKGTSKVS